MKAIARLNDIRKVLIKAIVGDDGEYIYGSDGSLIAKVKWKRKMIFRLFLFFFIFLLLNIAIAFKQSKEIINDTTITEIIAEEPIVVNQANQEIVNDVEKKEDKVNIETKDLVKVNKPLQEEEKIEITRIEIDSGVAHNGEKSLDGKKTIAKKGKDGLFHFPLSNDPPIHGDGTYFLAPYEHGQTLRVFEPGKMNGTRTDVIRKCFVNPIKYRKHIQNPPICNIAEKYKLLFVLVPKSGSSTGRHVMKYDFGGKDIYSCPSSQRDVSGFDTNNKQPYFIFTVLRNPITRYYASHDELMVRKLGFKEHIPPEFSAFMEPLRGKTYDQHYKFMFDNKEGIEKLTWSFNQFVRDWNGYDAFDNHLTLQTPMLSSHLVEGKVRTLDMVFDTHLMEESFNKVAEIVHAPKPKSIIAGRAYPRRFNVSAIAPEVMEKICKLSSIDFCCLNYELPEFCKNLPEGHRVACREFRVTDENKHLKSQIMIEPVLV